MTDERSIRAARLLDDVFGPGVSVQPAVRARESSRIYVRGLDLLTLDESPKATGRRLTAREAYDAYGFQKLYEVATDGSAIISHTPGAAGRVLRQRREELGLPLRTVANKAGVTVAMIEALELSSRRPVREYERVARVLGLDERVLSYKPLPEGNERLAVRLRTLADERVSMSPSSVASLSEAMWVAMTQVRLENELGLTPPDLGLQPSPDYGYLGHPPYEVGYDLANQLRDALKLGATPIASMRRLVEADLGIPVIQTQLNEKVAGATLESAGRRAIVLNIDGLNGNVLVRRSTLAHEVGHLLFDPSQQLSELRVDDYSDLEQRADTHADPVEQRANAFAAQLLAPQSDSVERFQERGDLRRDVLDHFGVSFTSGRYQVWNGMGRSVPLESISAPNEPPESDWEGRESYTLAYHPIRELASRPSRAGRFSAVVVRCAHLGIVSWDTASEWLSCSADDAQAASESLAELYPEVFEPGE